MQPRLVSLALTLGVVAAGGALAALGAFLTDHAADQPTLYVALGLAVREASKYLDGLDWTRSLRAKRSSSWKPPAPGGLAAVPAPGVSPGTGVSAIEPVMPPAPPASSPGGLAA